FADLNMDLGVVHTNVQLSQKADRLWTRQQISQEQQRNILQLPLRECRIHRAPTNMNALVQVLLVLPGFLPSAVDIRVPSTCSGITFLLKAPLTLQVSKHVPSRGSRDEQGNEGRTTC
ncbi:hypothetical protein Vafri_3621, partial [Volvox africanus]